MKRMKGILGVLLSFALAFGMAIGMSTQAFAENAAVDAAKSGVMKINLNIDGQTYGRGSCYLINEDTIITANHCVNLSQAEYDALYQLIGLNKEQVNATLSYTVTVARDLTVPATLVNSSEEMDFAILKLDQPLSLSKYTPLSFTNSSDCKATDVVYALGYPASKDTTGWFTSDDVKTESGILNQGEYETSMQMGSPSVFLPGYAYYDFKGKVLMLSAGTMSGGASGGPLVDENGNVIGVNICIDGSSNYASASSQIMETLDRLDITYTKAGAATINTVTLAALIDECKALKQSDYTSDSWAKLQSALTNAEDTLNAVIEENPTKEADVKAAQDKVDKAYSELGTAKTNLEKAPDYTLPIVIAVIVVVIVIVIVIVVVMSRKKKSGNGPAAPVPAAAPPAQPAAPAQPAPTPIDDIGSEGTEVLGAGAVSMPSAVIIREKDGKATPINKPEFKIGKQQAKVDYCIADNPSISRVHVIITYRDGAFYITDNRTTNHTALNGEILAGGNEVKLSDGDIIKMADERFGFKLN